VLYRKRVGREFARLAVSTVERIEAATRRTRGSTLARVAGALSQAEPSLGSPQAIAARLVGRAGCALAAESPYAERIARRRARRARRAESLAERADRDAQRARQAQERALDRAIMAALTSRDPRLCRRVLTHLQSMHPENFTPEGAPKLFVLRPQERFFDSVKHPPSPLDWHLAMPRRSRAAPKVHPTHHPGPLERQRPCYLQRLCEYRYRDSNPVDSRCDQWVSSVYRRSRGSRRGSLVKIGPRLVRGAKASSISSDSRSPGM
jgi:hypothetical protein